MVLGLMLPPASSQRDKSDGLKLHEAGPTHSRGRAWCWGSCCCQQAHKGGGGMMAEELYRIRVQGRGAYGEQISRSHLNLALSHKESHADTSVQTGPVTGVLKAWTDCAGIQALEGSGLR